MAYDQYSTERLIAFRNSLDQSLQIVENSDMLAIYGEMGEHLILGIEINKIAKKTIETELQARIKKVSDVINSRNEKKS